MYSAGQIYCTCQTIMWASCWVGWETFNQKVIVAHLAQAQSQCLIVIFSWLSGIKHKAKDGVLKLFKVTWVFDPDPVTIQGTCSLIEYTANEVNCGPRNQTQVLSWIFFIEEALLLYIKRHLEQNITKKKKSECSGLKAFQPSSSQPLCFLCAGS